MFNFNVISDSYDTSKIFLSKFQTEGLTNNIQLEYTLTGGFIVNTDFNAITTDSLFVALPKFQIPHLFRSLFINPHLINQKPLFFEVAILIQCMSICNVERGCYS